MKKNKYLIILLLLIMILIMSACTYKGCVHLPSENVEVTLSDTLVTINNKEFPVYSSVHKRTYSEYDTEEYSIVATSNIVKLYDHEGMLKCTIIE